MNLDINECDDADICGYGNCSNTNGSYLCQCLGGYHIVNNKCEGKVHNVHALILVSCFAT